VSANVDSLIARYLAKYQSDNTREAYERALRYLRQFCPVDMLSATSGDVQAAAVQWVKSTPSPPANASYNLTVSAWNSFYAWLYENDHIPKRLKRVTLKPIDRTVARHIPSKASVTSVWRLLDVAYDRTMGTNHAAHARVLQDRTLFLLCVGGGLRVSEIIHLRIGDIDTTNYDVPVLRIRSDHAKRYKARTVALPNVKRTHTILDDIARGRDSSEYVLLTSKGKTFCAEEINRRLRRLFRRIGAPPVYTVHAFRRYYATRALEEGVPVEVLSKQMGHADLATTMQYTNAMNRVVACGSLDD
jgi:site-specific recombinase XerD